MDTNGIDFESGVEGFLNGRTPTGRDSSFDYCFNYFQDFRERRAINSLRDPDHMERSALELGFYLASWGMYRGSSKLSDRSVRALEPVIEAIAIADEALWEIDADSYSEENIKLLLEHKRDLSDAFDFEPTETLITKVLLGVYGSVPAFDTYFQAATRAWADNGRGFGTLNRDSLVKLRKIYEANKDVIDGLRGKTLAITGSRDEQEFTDRLYTRAKVIDMACFWHRV